MKKEIKKIALIALLIGSVFLAFFVIYVNTQEQFPVPPEKEVIKIWIPENALWANYNLRMLSGVKWAKISLTELKAKCANEEKVIMFVYQDNKKSLNILNMEYWGEPRAYYWLPGQKLFLTYDFLGRLASLEYYEQFSWIVRWFALLPWESLEYRLRSVQAEASEIVFIYGLHNTAQPKLQAGGFVYGLTFLLAFASFCILVIIEIGWMSTKK